MHRAVIIGVLTALLCHEGGKVRAEETWRDVLPPPQVKSQYTPIVRVPPQYPPSAVMRLQSGWVLIEFTISEQGLVLNPRVLRSSDEIFEQTALRAILRWKYRPQMAGGVPVRIDGVKEVIIFDATDERVRNRAERLKKAEKAVDRKQILQFRCEVLHDPEYPGLEAAEVAARELVDVYVSRIVQHMAEKYGRQIKTGAVAFVTDPDDHPRGAEQFSRYVYIFQFFLTPDGRWHMVR